MSEMNACIMCDTARENVIGCVGRERERCSAVGQRRVTEAISLLAKTGSIFFFCYAIV